MQFSQETNKTEKMENQSIRNQVAASIKQSCKQYIFPNKVEID